jgi:dethiobiotin synthetase
MVPIRADYFVSDLAVAMNLPVLVVAQNRLGCLNHTVLTVQSVRARGLDCVGVVLNGTAGPVDIAFATNEDVLGQILDVPILSGLTGNMPVLPAEWGRILAHLS